MNANWFNLAPSPLRLRGHAFWPYQLFRRVTKDGPTYWGFGIVQINGRHLFYIGKDAGELMVAALFSRRRSVRRFFRGLLDLHD